MAIDLIPKQSHEPLPFLKVLALSSIIFLAITILFLAVLWKFVQIEKNKVVSLDNQLSKQPSQEEKQTEEEVLTAQRRISIFSTLMSLRKPVLPVLGIIEKDSHPKNSFNKLMFSIKDDTLWLDGQADSFYDLGQQQNIFKKDLLIEESNLIRTEIGKTGFIDFGFQIKLNQEAYREK